MNGLAVIPRTSIALGGRILRLSDHGRDVRELQSALKEIGFFEGALDGQFGLLTEEAVVNLQTVLGMRPDGLVGPKLIRVIQKRDYPKWIIHRVKTPEEIDSIAKNYDLHPSAIRLPLGKASLHPGSPVCIPCRDLWLYGNDRHIETTVSAYLWSEENELINEPGCPCYRVLDGHQAMDINNKERFPRVKVIDARGLTVEEIRRLNRRLRRERSLLRGKPWLWVSDQTLAVPGSIQFLGIEKINSGFEGVIVAIGPGSRVRVPNLRLPSMLSIDLRAVLREGYQEKRLIAKEARHRILLTDQPIKRQGSHLWAVWPQDSGEAHSELIMPDFVTIESVCREIISKNRTGLVVTGVESPSRRLINLRKKFFAVHRDMNGSSLTYI